MQCDGIHSCDLSQVGLVVQFRVLSAYTDRNALLIDMGWTGCSAQGEANGYGRIISHPELKIKNLKQETGEVVPYNDGDKLDFSKYPTGTLITFAPWHSCAAAH